MRVLIHLMCVAFALGLASCSLFDQGGQTTVEGTVVDGVSRQSVGSAEVRLFTRSRRVSASASSSALHAEGDWRPTNMDGSFSFSFEANNDLEYVLLASSPRGNSDFLTAPKLKGGHKNKNVQVPVNAPAWVRIHLRDEPPRTDAVNIIVGGVRESVTLAPPLDTVLVRTVVPGTTNVILWQLNGSRVVAADEHRIPYIVAGMDTAQVEIRY